MNLRDFAREWVPPGVRRFASSFRVPPEQKAIQRYLERGRIPWSEGYGEFRRRTIIETIDDRRRLGVFARSAPLPEAFGYGLDERCVEYPWLLSKLAPLSGRLLDAGSALNYEFLIRRLVAQGWKLDIVTLAPEASCFWRQGVSYLYDDIRDLPLADDRYDAIVCASALEHVGFDNSAYTGTARSEEEPGRGDYARAVDELWRVLRRGGTLLVTVPFGRPREFATFRQFDGSLLEEAMAVFGPTRELEKTFFAYRDGGWVRSDEEDCEEAEFVDWICQPLDRRPPLFPIQPDNAAAARAVACLRVVKA